VKPTPQLLRREYRSLMRAHLARPDEFALERAYNLGRKSLDQGFGVIDIAAQYHRALLQTLRRKRRYEDCIKAIEDLEGLFVESLTPYEMTHRGHQDAHETLSHLNEILEEEAKRIAHEIHDESGQLLVAVHIALEDLAKDLPPRFQKGLQRVRATLDEMEQQLRRLSRELRPPILDDLGLLPALNFLIDGFARRTGIKTGLTGLDTERFDPRVEIALYRIVQEALTNVSKHAQASSVDIHFQRSSGAMLLCSIRDDGKGFDLSRVLKPGDNQGFGLRGMRERLKVLGATMEIEATPGQGTVLIIHVPVES
jgi:signal transduction histidine kinase